MTLNTAGDSAPCVGSPLLGVEQSPIHREDDCYARSMSSWENIFAVAPAAGKISLGCSFVRATQQTANVEYTLAAVHGDPPKDGHGERATLTLGQDLCKLGLGAVVWDCVSAPTDTHSTACRQHPYSSLMAPEYKR